MNKKKLKRQFIEDLNKEYKIKLDFENIDEVLEGRRPASERDIKDLITDNIYFYKNREEKETTI